MTLKTGSYGIFQSDVIIRTALQAAIADLRGSPYLLNYIFASLPADALTANEYGDKDVQSAREWFLANEIDVRMNVLGEPPSFPCITVALLESSEVPNEATLGDVDAQVMEDNDDFWPTIAGPFTPAYDALTGILTLPASIGTGVPLFEGMVIVDRAGTQYPIIEVGGDFIVTIASGLTADFTNAELRAPRPAFVTTLESASFRETYQVGCHAIGKPIYTIILHSVVIFAMLRYRQKLLEARGFERSTLSSSELRRNDATSVENVYSRYFSVQGYVRHYWPKFISPKLVGVTVKPRINGTLDVGTDDDEADLLGGKP